MFRPARRLGERFAPAPWAVQPVQISTLPFGITAWTCGASWGCGASCSGTLGSSGTPSSASKLAGALGSMSTKMGASLRQKAAAAASAAQSAMEESNVSARVAAVGRSLTDVIDETAPDQVDEMLREKNRLILELQAERASLQAQLKRARSGEALAEALQAAKDRTAELESVKARAVAKFKTLSGEKAQLEKEVLELKR